MVSKRIVVQDYAGHPFPVQLSRELAKRGYHVLHLYAGFNQTPRGSLQKLQSDPQTFDIKGVYIRKPLQKYSFFKRRFQEREYGYLAAKEIVSFRPDVVISANTPLDTQSILIKTCKAKNIRFMYWMQDVISIAAKLLLGKRLPVIGSLIGDYYIALEKRLLRKSDYIVLIADEYEPFLVGWGISTQKMSVIYNWAPLSELPALPKDNPWAREHGLDDKFCFLYSGTLGMKHNPEVLLALALHYKNDPHVRVFVGSEGLGADWLQQKKKELDLPNLILMGFQPMEKLPEVLAVGDVLIAILEPHAGVFSVPSKVLSYLCAKRPLLLSVPAENLAAKIVVANKAGVLVQPNDIDGMIQKADEFYRNPALRLELSKNARVYAESNFDIELIADKFETLITRISSGN